MPHAADLAFYALAAVLLAAALGVVTAKSLFRAAFALAAALAATGGLYLALTAPLLAAVQILLYTGGVLTLVVFALVIAGTNEEGARFRKPFAAAFLALAVFIALTGFTRSLSGPEPGGSLESAKGIGTLLFRDYLVPFELLSVLLLGAVFGALLVARKDSRA